MPTNNYLKKSITNAQTGVTSEGYRALDAMIINTMSFRGSLHMLGYVDETFLSNQMKPSDKIIYSIADCTQLPAFVDIFAEIVGLMITDTEQPFAGAVLKESAIVGRYLEKDIVDENDGVSRPVWQANGDFVTNLSIDRAHIQVRGYASLAVLEEGGASTKTINFSIPDVFSLDNFEAVYNQIVELMINDAEQPFENAVLTEVPTAPAE